jgi:hypothetical protein
MSDYGCSCCCRWSCAAVALVVSVILGVVAAFLQFAGVIAVAAALLGVAFAVAVGYLAVLLVAAVLLRRRETERCLCGALGTALAGSLGTALFSVVLLVVDVAATSAIGAILVGLLVLFATLLLTGTACLVQCIAGCER